MAATEFTKQTMEIRKTKNLPIVGVNSVELLAGNMNLCDKKICSILDAQRTQVYMGQYKFENNKKRKYICKIYF